jgi:hypothetical protein
MLDVVPTPQQLACQVEGSVNCDSGSMVAGATCLVTEASGIALDGGVCFLDEFSVTADAFALGQVLNFGWLAYITDCYGDLCPLHRAASLGNEPSVSPPPQISRSWPNRSSVVWA